jgi:hypothetical protein
MRANEAVTAWAIVAPFILFALLGHDLATRDDVRLQTLSAKACEQRAVDGEKARKQSKDEKECRELSRTAYTLISPNPSDEKFIDTFNISYEKCMEVRGSKP